MLAKVHSFVLRGIDALRCEVEVDLNAKAQSVTGEAIRPTIVGLADVAVREAMDRIKSALFNSGCMFPEGKVLVNLAPADLKKEGFSFAFEFHFSSFRSNSRILT